MEIGEGVAHAHAPCFFPRSPTATAGAPCSGRPRLFQFPLPRPASPLATPPHPWPPPLTYMYNFGQHFLPLFVGQNREQQTDNERTTFCWDSRVENGSAQATTHTRYPPALATGDAVQRSARIERRREIKLQRLPNQRGRPHRAARRGTTRVKMTRVAGFSDYRNTSI